MTKDRSMKGIVFDVIKYAVHDGPGIRTTVFLKGCPLRCWWCQNPESLKLEPEKVAHIDRRKYSNLFYSDNKNIIGRKVTVKQVMAEVEKDMIFYKQSGGGVTFSGGEPLMQPDFLFELLKTSKKKGIHAALDTSGFAPWSVLKRMMKYVDLFLYDLKLMDDKTHQKYTGESNKLILDNLKKLACNSGRIIIRFPVILGITDRNDNIHAIGRFVRTIKCIEQLHLLPYNYMCKDKYRRLKKKYTLKHIEPPSVCALRKIKKGFEKFGLHVKIRG